MENSQPTVSYANVTSKLMHPKKDQAIVIDSIDGITLRDYLLALSTVTKAASIRFISRIANSRVCIYMDSKQTADELIDSVKKVKINEHLLEIRPLISRNKRIVLSNVCPVIPHELIEDKFKQMNIQILSPITFLKVGIPDPGFSHIMSFRRQLYVSPEDERRLPESMQISFEDTNYWIYITNDSMKCFVCNGTGHAAKHCPQSKQNLDSTPILTTPLTVNNEETNYPPIQFNKPRAPLSSTSAEINPKSNTLKLNAIKDTEYKGTKRVHSPTTTEQTQSEPSIPNILVNESPSVSDFTDDTGSNYSVDDEPLKTKSLRKKKKSLDNRTEEQVWEDIKFELSVSSQPPKFPLTLDQLISLLDNSRGKQNVIELVCEYTDNFPELIKMCLYLHPKMNKNLKNRCSRLCRKLQEILPTKGNESD